MTTALVKLDYNILCMQSSRKNIRRNVVSEREKKIKGSDILNPASSQYDR